jgi:sucrose-6-phosphate hydrolase SacC (GH32 family)
MPFCSLVISLLLSQTMTQPYHEALRPQFHFTAKTNWLNDPNGLVYYNGTYHMFFQHNPTGIDWGNMTWGHATSPDLVHWTQNSNAIDPDELGTIFSGSAVVDWKNTAGFQTGKDPAIVAIYTSAGDTSPESKGKPFTQCLAYSSDAGKTWKKYGANPVLNQIAGGNRDPKVVWYEPQKEWVMALYFEGNDFGLFKSADLKHWEPLQRFKFDGADECPDIFEIPVEGTQGSKWVISSASGRYLVGTFDGSTFTPVQSPQNMDQGPNYYAVQSYSDIAKKDGRRIQIAWMRGGSYPGMPFNQQMSFPCVLTLHREGSEYRIYRNPIREIKSLYGSLFSKNQQVIHPGENVLAGVEGDLWDLEFAIELGDAKQVVLGIRGTQVIYDVASETLECGPHKTHLAVSGGELKLRALIDRTSFELYGNGGAFSYTSCFLPELENHSLSLTMQGGTAKLKGLKAHQLHSTWPQAQK